MTAHTLTFAPAAERMPQAALEIFEMLLASCGPGTVDPEVRAEYKEHLRTIKGFGSCLWLVLAYAYLTSLLGIKVRLRLTDDPEFQKRDAAQPSEGPASEKSAVETALKSNPLATHWIIELLPDDAAKEAKPGSEKFVDLTVADKNKDAQLSGIEAERLAAELYQRNPELALPRIQAGLEELKELGFDFPDVTAAYLLKTFLIDPILNDPNQRPRLEGTINLVPIKNLVLGS